MLIPLFVVTASFFPHLGLKRFINHTIRLIFRHDYEKVMQCAKIEF